MEFHLLKAKRESRARTPKKNQRTNKHAIIFIYRFTSVCEMYYFLHLLATMKVALWNVYMWVCECVCVLLWVLLLSYQFKTKQKYTTKNGLYTLHWGERVYNTLFGRFVCSVVRCWWCFTLSFSSKTLNNSINNNEFANPPKNRNDFQTYWIWTASEKKNDELNTKDDSKLWTMHTDDLFIFTCIWIWIWISIWIYVYV